VYNRYIPEDVSYTRVEPQEPQRIPERPGNNSPSRPPAFPFPELRSGKEGLSGLIKTLHLDKIDSGDVLLLLIMLYLFAEGDDLELVIALGLTLLMGLGDDKEK